MMNILRKVFYLGIILFIKQAYCNPGRMRDKMLGHEVVKVSCITFRGTLDKTEHMQLAFLNNEDKAEGACAPLSGKLMTGCPPKWERIMGTHSVRVSFSSRQYKKKIGRRLHKSLSCGVLLFLFFFFLVASKDTFQLLCSIYQCLSHLLREP